MLTRLSIRNIVLIEALDLDFAPGLGFGSPGISQHGPFTGTLPELNKTGAKGNPRLLRYTRR